MNQATNQMIGGQPLRPQNNIHVNLSFDNLTAEQKYEYLTKGIDPFVKGSEAINQTISQFSGQGTCWILERKST
ncbi:2472_t:CDS:2 [Dentiscutata erythropus]|uniref:2472_t:CDS:1 n=1 Tax=Dentiscutata erythropus TaxID=1348616 RepID=A0A9N9BH49_9GLOM|nr:2472_t:CDS:2 [Dentiscutata erythropus]